MFVVLSVGLFSAYVTDLREPLALVPPPPHTHTYLFHECVLPKPENHHVAPVPRSERGEKVLPESQDVCVRQGNALLPHLVFIWEHYIL